MLRYKLRSVLIVAAIGPPLFVAACLGFKQLMLTWVLVFASLGLFQN